jgi:hypothetical protein
LDADVANASVVTCAASWDGRQVPLSIPALLDDHELCAANVSFLLKTFKENTATIFRFCLLEKRVLFLGRSSPAWVTCKMVSLLRITDGHLHLSLCLIIPFQVIIAASLVGAARRHVLHATYPYASLVDTSFLTTAGYIAGDDDRVG